MPKAIVPTKTKPAAKPLAAPATAAAKPAAKAAPTVKPPAAAKPKAAVPAAAPAMKLSIALDAPKAAIEKFISSIALRGAKLDTDMHSAACASLNHAALHNDPTLLCRFVNAMPKSGRKNAVIVWALKHGNVALNEDKSTKANLPLVYLKGKVADIPAAVAEPFWMLKNVKEGGSEWLYMDYIGGVMKKLASVAIDMKNPEHAKAKAALDALNAVNEALNTVANAAAPAPTQFLPTPEVIH